MRNKLWTLEDIRQHWIIIQHWEQRAKGILDVRKVWMEGKSTDHRTGREGTGVGLEEFGAIKRKNIIEGFIDHLSP